LVASLDGSISFKGKIKGKKSDAEKLGVNLANELLKSGAKKILKEINEIR
jgi:hydroxymethylbilane synthase